jgi:hypothetical protein
MTNKYTHLTPAPTGRSFKATALCGRVFNGRSLAHVEATPEAAALIDRYSFLAPLCPRCAAGLLIAETVTV